MNSGSLLEGPFVRRRAPAAGAWLVAMAEKAMTNPVVSRKFFLFAAGEAASLLGDQFTRVAAIWLILSMTSDSAAVGIWLAVGAFPRAVFILVGGALVDRFQPRTMMIFSNVARMALAAALAAAAFTNAVTMPLLYGFAAGFGVAGAAYLPAVTALTPRLASPEGLQRANAVVQGLLHLSNLVGPPMAAMALSYLLSGLRESTLFSDSSLQTPYGALFAIDALTFLASLWALCAIGRIGREAKPPDSDRAANPFRAIALGLAFAGQERRLRLFLLVTITANLGLAGPLAVGIPVLAKFTFEEGVMALGALSSAGAFGGLLGLTLASLVPAFNEAALFKLPFAALPVLALLLVSLGFAPSLPSAMGVIAVLAALGAFVDVQSLTWIQKTTERAYLGRVMSILQFGALGIAPVSMALAGALGDDPKTMFGVFGAGLLIAAFLTARAARRFSRRGPCRSG